MTKKKKKTKHLESEGKMGWVKGILVPPLNDTFLYKGLRRENI